MRINPASSPMVCFIFSHSDDQQAMGNRISGQDESEAPLEQQQPQEPEELHVVSELYVRLCIERGAHEPPKAAKEHQTEHACASTTSRYSRVPNFYFIRQEAINTLRF